MKNAYKLFNNHKIQNKKNNFFTRGKAKEKGRGENKQEIIL